MIGHTLASLLNNKVLFSTSTVFHADSVKVLPVLKAIQVNSFTAIGTVRVSAGKFTTAD